MSPIVDVGRLQLTYNHPHDLFGILEVFVLDIYKVSHLRSGDVVLDIGAGVGDFTLAASRAVGPAGLVVAVEPSPTDFADLVGNTRQNRISNVAAFNCTIGSGGARALLSFKGSSFEAETRSYRSILDDLAARGGNLSRSLDFIKLDVEGAEAPVLAALAPYLGSVRGIAIELHQTKADVDRILLPRGFTFSPLSRSYYLQRAARYAIRHPILAHRLFASFKRGAEYPGLRKILGGIEITKGERLAVGLYERVAESPA